MTLEPGGSSSLLVGVLDVATLEAPAEDTAQPDTGTADGGSDTGNTDTGGTGDTAGDGGSEVDTGEPADTWPDLTACEAPGYVTASTTASYSGGSGGLANLGTLTGYGWLCGWSCSGDPWWVVLSVTTDGTCSADAGALPLDVGAAGSLELCARVYASGVDGGSYTTCTATYTGGSAEIEVSG